MMTFQSLIGPTAAFRHGLIAVLSLLLVACASGSPQEVSEAPPAPRLGDVDVGALTDPDTYELRPGDTLRVTVFQQDNLSDDYKVDAGGNIAFRLIGQIRAAGRTAPEVQEEIRQRLDAEYLVNPRVSAEIAGYRPIFITGQVNRPGRYEYEVGMFIESAVALGGGYTRRAREDVFGIQRRNANGELVTYRAAGDTVVLPGDVIEVYRRVF